MQSPWAPFFEWAFESLAYQQAAYIPPGSCCNIISIDKAHSATGDSPARVLHVSLVVHHKAQNTRTFVVPTEEPTAPLSRYRSEWCEEEGCFYVIPRSVVTRQPGECTFPMEQIWQEQARRAMQAQLHIPERSSCTFSSSDNDFVDDKRPLSPVTENSDIDDEIEKRKDLESDRGRTFDLPGFGFSEFLPRNLTVLDLAQDMFEDQPTTNEKNTATGIPLANFRSLEGLDLAFNCNGALTVLEWQNDWWTSGPTYPGSHAQAAEQDRISSIKNKHEANGEGLACMQDSSNEFSENDTTESLGEDVSAPLPQGGEYLLTSWKSGSTEHWGLALPSTEVGGLPEIKTEITDFWAEHQKQLIKNSKLGESTPNQAISDEACSDTFQEFVVNVPLIESTQKADQCHHQNFSFLPVHVKSKTPAVISLWATLSYHVSHWQHEDNAFTHKSILVSQAAKYIDPFVYDGPDEFLTLPGTALRDAVTGYARICYEEIGGWVHDERDEDDDLIYTAIPGVPWYNSKSTTHARLPQPYIVDPVFDDDWFIHNIRGVPAETKQPRKTGRSRLCIMENAYAESDLDKKTSSPSHVFGQSSISCSREWGVSDMEQVLQSPEGVLEWLKQIEDEVQSDQDYTFDDGSTDELVENRIASDTSVVPRSEEIDIADWKDQSTAAIMLNSTGATTVANRKRLAASMIDDIASTGYQYPDGSIISTRWQGSRNELLQDPIIVDPPREIQYADLKTCAIHQAQYERKVEHEYLDPTEVDLGIPPTRDSFLNSDIEASSRQSRHPLRSTKDLVSASCSSDSSEDAFVSDQSSSQDIKNSARLVFSSRQAEDVQTGHTSESMDFDKPIPSGNDASIIKPNTIAPSDQGIDAEEMYVLQVARSVTRQRMKNFDTHKWTCSDLSKSRLSINRTNQENSTTDTKSITLIQSNTFSWVQDLPGMNVTPGVGETFPSRASRETVSTPIAIEDGVNQAMDTGPETICGKLKEAAGPWISPMGIGQALCYGGVAFYLGFMLGSVLQR